MKSLRLLLVALLVLSAPHAGADPVDINRADAEQIAEQLQGIGPARARAIVEYRDKVGGFDSPEQLLEVAGVGPRVLEMNEGRITVSATESADR
jgi:competence protein ComEA